MIKVLPKTRASSLIVSAMRLKLGFASVILGIGLAPFRLPPVRHPVTSGFYTGIVRILFLLAVTLQIHTVGNTQYVALGSAVAVRSPR